MRRVALLLSAVAITSLTACGSDQSGNGPLSDTKAITVELPDGREVVCVRWSGSSKGGLDCNWEGAQ